MKTLLALMLMTSSAYAGFEPRKQVTAEGTWECAMTKIMPREASTSNPVYKVMVVVSFEPMSMDVFWSYANGREVDRSKQYSRRQQMTRFMDGTVKWTGQIGDRPGNWYMTGVLDPNRGTYTEDIEGQMHMESRCHQIEGD